MADDNDDEATLLGAESGVGREQLIGEPLWARYSAKVKARMGNPRHRGAITRAEADALGCDVVAATHGAESCGDAVRLFWAVDRKTRRIRAARFQTFGCATAIAASDAMAEMCVGKTPEEAVRDVTNVAVEAALRDDPATPAVPPQKMHCSVMAQDVVRAAAALCSPNAAAASAAAAAAKGEDGEIVCRCAGVSLGTVRRAIRQNNLSTVAQITEYTKAGGFCGSCVKPGGHEKMQRYLIDILREELKRRKETPASAAGDQQQKQKHLSGSPARRAAAVQRAIDTVVTPELGAHGGSVEIVDVTVAADGGTSVQLSYRGSCASCPNARAGTLAFIRDALRKELASPDLDVAIAE